MTARTIMIARIATLGWLLAAGSSLVSVATAQAPPIDARVLPDQVNTMPRPSDDTISLSRLYDWSLEPAFKTFGGEINLLPNQDPTTFRVELELIAGFPAGWSQLDQRIEWACIEGRIRGKGNSARYYPPRFSRHEIVKAELLVRLRRPDGEVVTLRDVRSLELLTPCSALEMVAGEIENYRVGAYLDPFDPRVLEEYNVKSGWFRKHAERYRIPDFFYRVDPKIKDRMLTPHQRLGDWMIDFPWKSLGETQYIALDLNLVEKLNELVELMRAEGYPISRLVFLYGFRPPAFNLGQIEENPDTNLKEPFSMHQYGRAVDIIIDEDGDGMLDDLNGDGRIDIHDAAVIMYYVNQLDRRYRAEGRLEMVGGAGLYTHNDFVQRSEYYGQDPYESTPYIHVDTRGFLRDNGTLVRWPSAWPDGRGIRFGHIGPEGYELTETELDAETSDHSDTL